MKSIHLSLLLWAGLIASASGDLFRTDINPALRYYQAYLIGHNLNQGERDYLLTNEWRGQRLTAKFGGAVTNYDNQFKTIRQAAQAQVPCEWGIDLSEGPLALLPGLAPAKGIAQITRLRVMWDLQEGRQAEARDDILAALALARNVSRDGVLISALVQIAMENILIVTIAENYHQFTPETLKQLADGFDAAPARGTVAGAMAVEQSSFYGWFLRKLQDQQKQNPGNEAAVMAGIREIFGETFTGGDEADKAAKAGQASAGERIIAAAGGTSAGVLKLVGELPPMYDRATQILSLPTGEFEAQITGFDAEIHNSPNPLISELFPAFQKCRVKEFSTLVKLAMLRAGVEYKLRGEAGLNSVADPCGKGPFAFQRFVLDGVDRGFQLTSAYAGRGFADTLIFVEKDGVPFNVDGQHAGQALPKTAAAKE